MPRTVLLSVPAPQISSVSANLPRPLKCRAEMSNAPKRPMPKRGSSSELSSPEGWLRGPSWSTSSGYIPLARQLHRCVRRSLSNLHRKNQPKDQSRCEGFAPSGLSPRGSPQRPWDILHTHSIETFLSRRCLRDRSSSLTSTATLLEFLKLPSEQSKQLPFAPFSPTIGKLFRLQPLPTSTRSSSSPTNFA